MDEETFRLLGKRAKLDSAKLEDLPLLINEKWGSQVLKQAYNDRLSGEDKKQIKDEG